MSMPFNLQIISGNKVAEDNTYREDEILMPRSNKSGVVPALIGIEVQHPTILTDEADVSEWALSTKSNDAMPDLDDSEVVAKGKRHGRGAKAAGLAVDDVIERITFPAPIPISSDKLYMQFLQNTTGAANHTYRYRLLWLPRYVRGVVQQQQMQSYAQF